MRLAALLSSMFLAVTCCGPAAAHDTPAASAASLAQLVTLSAQRLELSRQVALTKWDTKAPVADPPGDPREQQVIDAAAAEARDRGLAATEASSFFSDQIEASKLVQYGLMAGWLRDGKAPSDRRADLVKELRPALDALRPRFITALLAAQEQRAAPNCKRDVAAAVKRHVEQNSSPALFAVALDRGLARVCGG